MRAILIYTLLSCIALSSALRPSFGCSHQKPPLPRPGHHHRFDVTYNDANIGEIYRHYILQIPNGKKHIIYCKSLLPINNIIIVKDIHIQMKILLH